MRIIGEILILITLGLSASGCSSKMWKVVGVGAATGAVGAGVGYAFVHHGKGKEYQTTNTIISASIFAAIGAGITYWHLTSLENQQVELAGRFSRSNYLERDANQFSGRASLLNPTIGTKSLKLDDTTRWVFPEFQKRELPPQRGENELISSHYSWEVLRPGYFVSKDQDPSLFKEESTHE